MTMLQELSLNQNTSRKSYIPVNRYKEGSFIKPKGELASNNKLPEGAWVQVAKTQAKALLNDFSDLHGIYGFTRKGKLHLYALDNSTRYNHNLTMAISLLEINLFEALENNFDDIEVHIICGTRQSSLLKDTTKIL